MSENLQVALNYLFIITLFPIIFIIYQKHVLRRELACWRRCIKDKTGNNVELLVSPSSVAGGAAPVPCEGTDNPLSETVSIPFSTPGINSFGIDPPLILLSISLPFPGS